MGGGRIGGHVIKVLLKIRGVVQVAPIDDDFKVT